MPEAGEPLWTDEDRAWAMALLEVEAETCKGCGQPLAESTDQALEEAYTAEVIRCHACTTAGHHLESWQKAGGDQHGANVRVTRRKGAS
ncbi:hypothetical protein [Kitasatospora sp. NPDC004272]